MGLTRTQILGLFGTGIALVGYVLGTQVAYPGRSFSLTLAMIAITLLAVGGARGDRG